MINLFPQRKKIITPSRHYSVFSSGNQLPLKGRPKMKSIQQLSADRDAVLYEQTGKRAVYDDFGVQKNVRILPDKNAREMATLALRNIYDTSDLASERVEAGRELGYTEYRINWHERMLNRNSLNVQDEE